MPRNSTSPLVREVDLDSNGRTRNKKKIKNTAGAVTYRTRNGTIRDAGSSVGGQSYVKFQGLGSVLGGFSGTDLSVERTEAMYTVVSSSTANAFRCESLTQFPCFSGFNWLKNMANSYSEYEVHRIEYTYVPGVPTTTGGTVAMSFYTDMRDTQPNNLAEILASEQSLMAPVYAGGDGGTYLQRFGAPAGNVVSFEVPQHVIRYSNSIPKRYKMTSDGGMSAILGAANGQAVANQYAYGKLNVASSGVASASLVLGTVFVRYRIKLFGPIPIGNQT